MGSVLYIGYPEFLGFSSFGYKDKNVFHFKNFSRIGTILVTFLTKIGIYYLNYLNM